MKVNYFISKWREGLSADFPKEGHLDMSAVPRKGDSIYIDGHSFNVESSASWMAESKHTVNGTIYVPRLYLT